jgi:hypothetical protein
MSAPFKPAAGGARRAHGLQLGRCPRSGALVLVMLDAHGLALCFGAIGDDEAAALIGEIADALEAKRAGGLAALPAEGRA